MNHSEAQSLLSHYVDDELSAEQRTEVAAHLEACAVCRAELADLSHLKLLLHRAPWVELPRSFTISAAAPLVAAPRWLRPVRYAAAIAAVLLITLIAGDAWNQIAQPAGQRTAISAATAVAVPVETPVGPRVAGARIERPDPRQPPLGEDSRPATNAPMNGAGYLVVEIAVGLILLGLLAAWLAGWWMQRSRGYSR